MPPRDPLPAFLAALALTVVLVAPAAAADGAGATTATADAQGEVLLDAGLTMPLGNLGAGFTHTQRGLGAGAGYLIGLRLRFYPAAHLVLAPSFSYLEFGAYEALDADGDEFAIEARGLRYGLDVLYLAPDSGQRVRPFVGGGVAIVRNMYRELFDADEFQYDAGVNSIAWSVQMGVRIGPLDLTLLYESNHFATSLLSFSGERHQYRWNHLLLRAGYRLPLF